MKKLVELWNVFMKEEDGIGTLEMLLIIAVILVVAIAFRKWILNWADHLFQNTNKNVNDTITDNAIQLPT
jgi:Flp pilus assembly pilin Flp